MNAHEIVGYLLEAEGDVIFAFVPRLTSKFGFGCPPKPGADPFATWADSFFSETPQAPANLRPHATESPEIFISLLLNRYDAVFVLVFGGEISVFSRKRRNKLPPEFLAKIRNMLDIAPTDQVGWFRDVASQPVLTTAAGVLYDEDEELESPSDKPLSRGDQARLRQKFWGTSGGYNPDTAPDIVDKLMP